jgi:hypothetical protein
MSTEKDPFTGLERQYEPMEAAPSQRDVPDSNNIAQTQSPWKSTSKVQPALVRRTLELKQACEDAPSPEVSSSDTPPSKGFILGGVGEWSETICWLPAGRFALHRGKLFDFEEAEQTFHKLSLTGASALDARYGRCLLNVSVEL